MKQYLTLEICDYTGTVEHFLRTRSGLTRRQISRAKFTENGIQRTGGAAGSVNVSPREILFRYFWKRKTRILHIWSPLPRIWRPWIFSMKILPLSL